MKRSEYKKLLLEFLQLNEEIVSTDLKKYQYFGYVEIKGKIYDVWNDQETKILILKSQDDENKFVFKDTKLNPPNQSSELVDVILSRSSKTELPKSFNYVDDNNKMIKANINTGPVSNTPSSSKKKSTGSSLSTSGIKKVKEIQSIIGTGVDGVWGPKTNAAWYKYIRDNHEIINKMIKDHEAPKKEPIEESRLMMLFEKDESGDFLTGEEEDGDSKMKAAKLAKKTGHSANLTGVTQFTRDVELKKASQVDTESPEKGTTKASAEVSSEPASEDVTDDTTLVTEISFEKDAETIKLNLNKEIDKNKYNVSITGEAYDDSKTNYIRVIFKNPIEADPELNEGTVSSKFDDYEYITGAEIGNDNSNQDLYIDFILNDQIDTKNLSNPITNLSDDSKTLTIDLSEMGLKDAEEAVIQKFDVNNDRVLKGLLKDIGTILVNSNKSESGTREGPGDEEVNKLLGRLTRSLRPFGNNEINLKKITSYLKSLRGTLDKMRASYEKQEKLINKHIKSFESRGSRRANRSKRRYLNKDIDFKNKLEESKHFRGESKMRRRRNLMSLVEGYLNEQDTGYYEKTKEKYGVGDKGSDKPRASKEYDNPFEYKDQDSNNTSSPKSKKSVKDWEDYVNSGRHKSSKQELADIWQAVAGEANYKGGKFKNKDNALNFPGNYSKNLTGDGFVKWYKHIKSSEHAMAIVDKKVGQEFNAKEALEILRVLTAFDNKKQENPVFDVKPEEKTEFEAAMERLGDMTRAGEDYLKKRNYEKKPTEIKEMFNKYTTDLYESSGESFEEKLKDYQSKGREVVTGKSEAEAKSNLGEPGLTNDVLVFKGKNKDGDMMYGAFLAESFSRGALYRKRYYGRR